MERNGDFARSGEEGEWHLKMLLSSSWTRCPSRGPAGQETAEKQGGCGTFLTWSLKNGRILKTL